MAVRLGNNEWNAGEDLTNTDLNDTFDTINLSTYGAVWNMWLNKKNYQAGDISNFSIPGNFFIDALSSSSGDNGDITHNGFYYNEKIYGVTLSNSTNDADAPSNANSSDLSFSVSYNGTKPYWRITSITIESVGSGGNGTITVTVNGETVYTSSVSWGSDSTTTISISVPPIESSKSFHISIYGTNPPQAATTSYSGSLVTVTPSSHTPARWNYSFQVVKVEEFDTVDLEITATDIFSGDSSGIFASVINSTLPSPSTSVFDVSLDGGTTWTKTNLPINKYSDLISTSSDTITIKFRLPSTTTEAAIVDGIGIAKI